MTTSQRARALEVYMKNNGKHGADDSEGWYAFNDVAMAGKAGQKFPLSGHNPFSLYEEPGSGWEIVSAKLVALAKEYHRSLIRVYILEEIDGEV